MPLYTFECTSCGPLEIWLSIKELNHTVTCPTCNTSIKRVYGSPGLIFTPKAIRKRIEYGAEPKRVKTEPRTTHHRHPHHSHRHAAPQRP